MKVAKEMVNMATKIVVKENIFFVPYPYIHYRYPQLFLVKLDLRG